MTDLKEPFTRMWQRNILPVWHIVNILVGERGGRGYAKRTARPEAPGGCDRQRCPYRQDRDRRDRRHETEVTGQAQERQGGCEGAPGEHDRRTAEGNRAQGCEREVGVMGVLTRPRWSHVVAAANKLTEDISSPPIPVYEIAERNGVNVVFVDFGPHAGSVSGLCDFEKARIYVNKDDSTERQAFTIGHELGHWLLHKEFFLEHPDSYPVLPRFSDPNRNDPMEKEANKFAACLLVPDRMLAPVKGAPVAALARSFGVSGTMMEFRLKNV